MSDFGRGYATCLIQFANHRARLGENVASYAKFNENHPDLFSPERAVEIWANGASDHLYELLCPKGLPAAEWRAAKGVADRALDIGHGYRSSKSTPEECATLLNVAGRLLASIGVSGLDAALEWDRAHGLVPDKGEWSCSEDLRRDALVLPLGQS